MSGRTARRGSSLAIAAAALGMLACGADERSGGGDGGSSGAAGTDGSAASGRPNGAGGSPSAGASTGGAAGSGAGSSGSAGAPAASGSGGAAAAGGVPAGGATSSAGNSGTGNGGAGGGAGMPSGPNVDRSGARLYEIAFGANDADAAATRALGDQHAFLDTRVAPRGKLVVYLHGAGAFSSCGGGALGPLVASFGFHWLAPCYLSDYGVDNCGDDIAGCRLEAFDGADHHPFVSIARPDSIEERLARGLRYVQQQNPQGDWQYYLEGNTPRWSAIVFSGHSHGASSSGLVAMHRSLARVVMLAGPYDPGQAWLAQTPLTARDRFFAFTHTGDSQHAGHLAALAALGVAGTPTSVDASAPPYSGSHRLTSSRAVSDAHGSVTSGDIAQYVPVWQYLFGP